MKKRTLGIGTFLASSLGLGYTLVHKTPVAHGCSDDCPLDLYSGTYHRCNSTTWDTGWECENPTTPGALCYMYASCEQTDPPTNDDWGDEGCEYDDYGDPIWCYA